MRIQCLVLVAAVLFSAFALCGGSLAAATPAAVTPAIPASRLSSGNDSVTPKAERTDTSATTEAPPAAVVLPPGATGAHSGAAATAATAAAAATTTPELSPLEKAVARQGGGDNTAPQSFQPDQLTQFGYNFFRSGPSGFTPPGDLPVTPDYVIGPGDRIILRLWGSVESSNDLEVNRSGEIFLPRVGALRVWGVTFGELPAVLRHALAKQYKDFDLNVALGKMRMIKVYVVGEVNAPGDYLLNPFSTLINALGAAGGPLKSGTLRNIQVRRGAKVVDTVDLYDFFLKGDKSRDLRLQSGDTIFVPVIGRVAAIAGNVKRPAIYELKGERNLEDLLALGEGLLSTGYLQRVQIARVVAHEKKVVADVNLEPGTGGESPEQLAKKILIQDLDLVTIFPIDALLRGHVRLQGYVLRPGDYALQPGMRLSSLLPPDNLLAETHDTAEITRLIPPDHHPELLYVNLAQALARDPGHDPLLKEYDRVKLFSRWEMEEMPKVTVSGEVQRPGEYRLMEKMTVRDLLLKAGKLKISAYSRSAEITRITSSGGKARSYPIVIDLDEALKGNPKHDLLLAPLDELTVRRIPNWSEEKERYVTLTGEVQFPGVYPIYKGERLSSVLERAGGFTGDAYLRGAKFTRVSVQQDQQKRMDEALAKTEQEILKRQAELSTVASSKEELESTRASLEALMKSLEKLKAAKAEGRVVLRLSPLAQLRNGIYDLELKPGDALNIPSTPKSVNVMGQVYNPTTLVCDELNSAGHYLEEAGGPTSDAEESDMYIIRADGSIFSSHQVRLGFLWQDSTRNWHLGSFLSTPLESGDTLVVPQKFERVAWMREIKDLTTILAQIALAAGVVLAAGL